MSIAHDILTRYVVTYRGVYYTAHKLQCGYVLHRGPGDRLYLAASDPLLRVLGRSTEYEAQPLPMQTTPHLWRQLVQHGAEAVCAVADWEEPVARRLEALRPALEALQDYLDAQEADYYSTMLELLPAGATDHDVF